jgi:hypothetical protein
MKRIGKKHLEEFCLKNPQCRYLSEQKYNYCLKKSKYKEVIDNEVALLPAADFPNWPTGDNCEGK